MWIQSAEPKKNSKTLLLCCPHNSEKHKKGRLGTISAKKGIILIKSPKKAQKGIYGKIRSLVIRVFWHAEFIFALKTELNSTVSEKMQKIK